MIGAELLQLAEVQLTVCSPKALRVALVRGHAAHLQQTLERVGLVANAELVPVVKAEHGAQVGTVSVASLAVGDQLNAPADVEILVADAIRLGGDVVGQIPALEDPRVDEVRLQRDDRLDQQFQLIPLVAEFFLVALVPQISDDQATRAGQRESDRRAGQVGLAEVGLAQLKIARLGLDSLHLRPGDTGVGVPDNKRHGEQQHDQGEVDELASRRRLLQRTGHGEFSDALCLRLFTRMPLPGNESSNRRAPPRGAGKEPGARS